MACIELDGKRKLQTMRFFLQDYRTLQAEGSDEAESRNQRNLNFLLEDRELKRSFQGIAKLCARNSKIGLESAEVGTKSQQHQTSQYNI